MRKRVYYQSAALRRRYRACISRESEALYSVDIRYACELVDLGYQEYRHQLIRDTQEIRESCHDLSHGHLVEENDFLVEL